MSSDYHLRRQGLGRRVALGLACLILVYAFAPAEWGSRGAAAAAASPSTPAGRIEEDFAVAWAELELAKTGEVYLVIDVKEQEISLRLGGAVIWESPVELGLPDSSAMAKLRNQLYRKGGSPVMVVTSRHLYASKEKFPDSTLAVVARAIKVKPGKIQRQEPEHLVIRWGRRLVMDLRTDVEGRSRSPVLNALVWLREAMLAPVTASRIRAHMDGDHALTFYSLARPGLPTLLAGL